MFHVSSPLEDNLKGVPEVVYANNDLAFALEPGEIRLLYFSVRPKEWQALKRLQGRTSDDYRPEPKPVSVPVADHPLLGVWSYTAGGGSYTREFKKDGLCVLRQGGAEIWTKPFAVAGNNTLVVEGRYRHELQPDGTLAIEGRYTAKRVR